MKYPKISRQPCREVNVPQLSGGLNLRDSLTGVRDNQMTDCVNVWYKDGMLRTRPGFESNENMQGFGMGNSGYKLIDKKVHYDIVKNNSILISYKITHIDGTDSIQIVFAWQNAEEQVVIGVIALKEECDYFVVEKDGILYCYLSNFSIYTLDYKKSETIWNLAGDSDYYIPKVMIHCQRTGVYDYSGTQFEGYNLLTSRYRIIYSAYNENDSNDEHPMRYNFGTKIATTGTIVATVKYIDDGGNLQSETHSVDAGVLANNRWVYENEPNKNDGLCMYACRDYVGFSNENGSDTMPVMKLNTKELKDKFGLIEDNIELEATAYQESDEKEKLMSKVFGMTQSIWFGGDANGINSGSRLFLCGNKTENEGALVIWSALNNPLYFNENNYVYVGNKAKSVTAFGKQGEKLIIFKPNETYYSYYVQNSGITADDLINQSIVDYEANSVCFPVVALHSTIGCDCPDTIQLCRNRLVWLNSNGKVYTLISANQYSEMTIYNVSEMVEKKLKQYDSEQLINATTQDFAGYYMLIIGDDALLMDYNSYGYTHIYSYSKTEDANLLIPWYCWKLLPEEYFLSGTKPYYCAVGDSIIAIYENRPTSAYRVNYSVLNIKNDSVFDKFVLYDTDNIARINTNAINSKVCTKLFDFNIPHYLKNIERVNIAFGNNGGKQIKLNFVTDKGSEDKVVSLIGYSTDEREAAFVNVKNFYPRMKAVRTFGVELECEGPFILDGISLQYRLLGGVK